MRDMYTIHLEKSAMRLSCTELLEDRLEHELAHIQRVLQGAVVFVRQLKVLTIVSQILDCVFLDLQTPQSAASSKREIWRPNVTGVQGCKVLGVEQLMTATLSSSTRAYRMPCRADDYLVDD